MIDGFTAAQKSRNGLRERAFKHGYLNGLFPGIDTNSRSGRCKYRAYDLRCAYDYGYDVGARKRRQKIASGEWVILNGVAGPRPECDTALLESIREYQQAA